MTSEKENKKTKRLFHLLDLDMKVTRENIPRVLTFILFLSFIVIIYIANKYYSEKVVIRINNLNKEIKELRAESITTKAELMNYSKQSEILKKAGEMGLKEHTLPPQKINAPKK
jgi:cell division protein FtsL